MLPKNEIDWNHCEKHYNEPHYEMITYYKMDKQPPNKYQLEWKIIVTVPVALRQPIN